MTHAQFDSVTRRAFSSGLVAAGAAVILRPGAQTFAAEPPPETTTLRLTHHKPACWAPQYVAEELLRAEGFSDLQYISTTGGGHLDDLLKSGQVDITPGFSGRQIRSITPGDITVFLSGFHAGCYSLIASDRIGSIRDLKGKTVWVGDTPRASARVFFAVMLSSVGIDPDRDVKYLWISKTESQRLFAEGKIDAFMSFAPEPQAVRDKKIGRVLIDTNVDRPWSQYFCCLMVGNREFVARNPVSTKRALRAILRACDICALEPERAADILIEKKVRKTSERRDIVQALKEIPYGKWREFNPEDTVRYYALRLHELGMIESSPQEIIARNTDWRFLKELRDELNIRL
jgi:NitT/TauT family transport system substrate-binding protein